MQSRFRLAGLSGLSRAFGKLLEAVRLFVLHPSNSSSRLQAHSRQSQKGFQSIQSCSLQTYISRTGDCPPLFSDHQKTYPSPKQTQECNSPRKLPSNSDSESYLKRPFWFRIDDLAKGILKPEYGPVPCCKSSDSNHTSSDTSAPIAGRSGCEVRK